MDKKRLSSFSLSGGMITLLASVIIRMANSMGMVDMHIEGLWKLSFGLLLLSIALSVSKEK